MRIISIDDNSFDAFIQIRTKDSNTSPWAQVTYSSIKSNGIDQNLFHNESFDKKVSFDDTGFPYFKNESIPLTEFKHIVNQNGWRITNNCYNFVDNNTGEINHIDDIIPGYGFTVLFEDDNYYVSKGDNPRKYRYNLINDGTLQNDQNEAELRIVYYDSQKFKAFVLADKTIDGENCFMLVDFHRMSQVDLKQFKEKYQLD